MVWCLSLESQRLTADTSFISAAKLKQQEHLDCYRARHRTGINNVIYFLTCFLPEIQMLMRWSLSLAGIYTTVEQDACFTINVLAKTGIRYTYSENILFCIVAAILPVAAFQHHLSIEGKLVPSVSHLMNGQQRYYHISCLNGEELVAKPQVKQISLTTASKCSYKRKASVQLHI